MWMVTTQTENSSASPRSTFAILYARLAFVKQVCLVVVRYIDADNEHGPDFLLRRSGTRDLVREAMIGAARADKAGGNRDN